jgi:myo-inositol-1(or 4)-monophosphatase
VTDWLEVFRAAAAAVGRVLEELPTRTEREPRVGDGQGGDETTAIDAAAEAAVVALLEEQAARGAGFTLVSEELGERVFGAGGDGLRVVCDPIDGSLNAKRGIPFFSLSLALASGPRMEDVVLGFVHDYGTGEEWVARRGEGAFLAGAPLTAPLPKEEIEILSFEATRTDLVRERGLAVDLPEAPPFAGAPLDLAARSRLVAAATPELCAELFARLTR